MTKIPVIDLGPFLKKAPERFEEAKELAKACRDTGFFYVINHGVDESLQSRLENLSREFFARPLDEKMKIPMALGGRAWRGYFPPKGELTSGRPDLKEGLYFGQELSASDPRVQAGTPLHGPNLFPDEPAELKRVVLEYMQALTGVGHVVMSAIALSLGLDETFFLDRYTKDPLILFRIFNYPVEGEGEGAAKAAVWGVGEHTDYGVLTLLKQDDSGGLEVKARTGWIAATPVKNSFVCNLGDMLDKMTAGRYRSTPHRVKPSAVAPRLSFPFFFDPNFFTEVKPLPVVTPGEFIDDKDERWDQSSVHAFEGTYGDYLLKKVSKVFPQLQKSILP